MPEQVMHSLSFDGKTASGSFTPSRKSFFVPNKHILSAARVTVIGSSGVPGRPYEVNISISTRENSVFVNSLWGDVLDSEPTIVGTFTRLSNLVPQVEYELSMTSSGFDSNEDVSVAIDLLELDTTVAEVTRDVLREFESTPGVKAMAFGISEASFAHFMTYAQVSPEMEIGTNSYLKMRIKVEGTSFPYWPFVHIDVLKEEFVISGNLTLTFFRTDNGADVARVWVALDVHAVPAMVTETKDSLQIQFRSAKIVEHSLEISYLDSTESGVLGGFPGISEFEDAVDGYLAQITSSKSNKDDLSFAIPAYLASRPMPDHWDHVQNMNLEFKGFSYQTVQVHSFPVSYLFIIFSVQSLGLPPPCYCEDELFSALETTTPATTISPIQKKGKHKWATPDHTDYSRFLAAAQISAFGLSEQTFHEIARPYASLSNIHSTSTKGTIYASAKFWYTTRLVGIEITPDGVKAILDATGEGSAKAAVRDKCDHDILKASARFRIGIDGSIITFSLNILQKPGNPPEISIEAVPVASLGKVDVDFSTPFDPPPPFDEFVNWILETVITSVGEGYIKMVNKDSGIRFMQTVQNNGSIRLRFVDNKFFNREAVVLLGQLWAQSWG